MASSWGDSWGTSWGDSWGTLEDEPTPGGSGAGGGKDMLDPKRSTGSVQRMVRGLFAILLILMGV
jgi:hypothetical protein